MKTSLGWAVMLTACASAPEVARDCQAPGPVAVSIRASERWNPDPQGNALPAELRLYQLNETSALEHASFEDLWQRAQETLGDTLIAEDSVTVYPSDHLSRRLTPSPETTAIVGLAIVREPQGRTFRAVVPMRLGEDGRRCDLGPSEIEFRLDGYRVEAVTPRASEERER